MLKILCLRALKVVPRPELPEVLWEHYMEMQEAANKERKAKTGEGLSGAQYVRLLKTYPKGVQMVVSYYRFDGDILNGGIKQVFYNSTPSEIAEMLKTLQTIGAKESAELLKQATAVCKRNYQWPEGSNKRWRLRTPPEDRGQSLEFADARCDEEYSRRDYALLADYLANHLEECIPGG
jgi:hypothetical protein